MDNTFQNAYMTTLFMNFGAKNLASGREFVQARTKKPIFPQEDKLHNDIDRTLLCLA